MTNKTYKAIFVTPELHKRIKFLALQEEKSMIDYLSDMMTLEVELNKKGKSHKDYPLKVSN